MLQPCVSCGRHARPPQCPFCGAALRACDASPRRLNRRTFTRSAIMGSAAVLAGCGGAQPVEEEEPWEDHHHGGGGCEDIEVTDDDGTTHVESVCAPYGAPPADALV